ncbi:MAG: hypothetical protein KAW12_04625 [Candidatus Aminicenantes bacterium]|nr:hypothetical protein [Candidatus Aminicenantes bacterium]
MGYKKNFNFTKFTLFFLFFGFIFSSALLSPQTNKIRDYDGIGLASMQYFSKPMCKNKTLQKIARWTFKIQLSLMKEISNTLQKHRNVKSYATILRLREDKILSPYPQYEKCLKEFHQRAEEDSFQYLNEIAKKNRVRIIIFSSIDTFKLDDFVKNDCRGDLEIDINIYYPKVNAFQQEPIIIASSLLESQDSTGLRNKIKQASAKALKNAIDDQITLF